MKTLREFPHLVLMYFLCVLNSSVSAGTPAVPQERDQQVLQTFLLHLLTDPRFDLTRVSTNGATIVLHARTPKKTGFIQPGQMRHDIGDHTLPADAESNLRRRNTKSDAKPDAYEAVEAYFTNSSWGAAIEVADLTDLWKQRRSFSAFAEAHPKARGWVEAYLPGYSQDGYRAVVRAGVGPSAHGAMVTALLEKQGGNWVVKWHHLARYA